MSIKKVDLSNLQRLVMNAENRYVKKTDIGSLAALNEIGMSNLAEALQNLINGKADSATTLAGYGITDGMTSTEIADAIATAIAQSDHLERKIVTNISDVNLTDSNSKKYIFLVPATDSKSNNMYDEYMVIDGELEKVGNWATDLSNYITSEKLSAALTPTTTGTGNVVTDISYQNGSLNVNKGATALTESSFESYTDTEIDSLFN